ncbi:hypothetical protein LSH36_621g00005 [Paralvinella palmiformis]|uniref:Uncharacterized protein n=1 Tax=Paralvinella palmiformis TaxID=53620 RepID=A0AAD9J4J6_9ANNE|nr:hypothetical protein LSH36_621g00005 [Paralvinella palmiformis]
MKKIASFRRSKSHEPSGQYTLPRQPEVKVVPSDYHHSTVPRVASSGGSKQRPSLSNLINIGKDDIRTSIEALDRILDEFDDESGISQGSDESLRKHNSTQAPAAGATAEQAARMIAAQLSDGKATLRLKKTKFSQSYLTHSPYQSNLYPLTRLALVSLTETRTSADIALWITETYKVPRHIKEWTRRGENLEDEDLPPPPPELLQSNDRPTLLNVQCSTPTHKQTNKVFNTAEKLVVDHELLAYTAEKNARILAATPGTPTA